MGKVTGIAWTDHTFNPWWGCTRVSPGCDHCYAETMDNRTGGGHWGAGTERRTFPEKHWNKPRLWNRDALAAGVRRRVFCASMADVFDSEAPAGEREKLWALIRETPGLDWQLLTKRPQLIARYLPKDWGQGYPNVWLGTTVESQRLAELRVLHLLEIPARVRFLSCEPLLEFVDLERITIVKAQPPNGPGVYLNALTGHVAGPDDVLPGRIHWVIAGGESGHGARPMAPSCARALRDQCARARVRVAFFFKQWGAWMPSGSCFLGPGGEEIEGMMKAPSSVRPILDGQIIQQFPEVAP